MAFGLDVLLLTSPDAVDIRADPLGTGRGGDGGLNRHAFVVNMDEHWFALRCVGGHWSVAVCLAS